MVRIIYNLKQYNIIAYSIQELKINVKLNYELNILTKGNKVEFTKVFKDTHKIEDYSMNELLVDNYELFPHDVLYLLTI